MVQHKETCCEIKRCQRRKGLILPALKKKGLSFHSLGAELVLYFPITLRDTSYNITVLIVKEHVVKCTVFVPNTSFTEKNKVKK